MDTLYWITIFILIVFLLGLTGTIQHNQKTTGHWIKGNYIIIAITIAATALIFLIIIITASKTIIPWFGKISNLGQMGDYFGGIFNPTIAFASTLILLFTIKIEWENSHKKAELLRRTELYNYLTKAVIAFENELNKKIFFKGDEEPESFLSRYTDLDGNLKTHLMDEVWDLMNLLWTLDAPGEKAKTPETKSGPIPPGVSEPFRRLRLTLYRIADGYQEVIKANDNPTIKLDLAFELVEWLNDQERRGLLANNEAEIITEDLIKLLPLNIPF